MMRWIGFGGTGLVMLAYIPQLAHLARARCTGGISLRAYAVWTAAASLLFSYAVSTGDLVFTILQSYQLLAVSSISFLSLRHRGTPCSEACGRGPWVPPTRPSGPTGLLFGRGSDPEPDRAVSPGLPLGA